MKSTFFFLTKAARAMAAAMLLCSCFFLVNFQQARAQAIQFTTSNLPLMALTTFGNDLSRNGTVTCQMKIWYNPTRSINSQFDPPDQVQDCGIIIRGHSSSQYPKTKFTLHFWTDMTGAYPAYINFMGIGLGSDWSLGK